MTVRDLYPDTYPSLLLDFANVKALDPRVTFARASGATYIDAGGLWQESSSDQPRFDHDSGTLDSLGFLIEEQRTNTFTNPRMLNGVPGTPGTQPSAMGNWNLSTSGLTIEYVQNVTYKNLTGVRYRLSGTAAATATVSNIFAPLSSGWAASASQNWTGSVFIAVLSGIGTLNNFRIQLSARAGGGTAGNSASGSLLSSLTTVPTRFAHTYANLPATTTGIFHQVLLGVTSGVVVDVTFELYWPQLEQGLFATSPILPPGTTIAASTRAADSASMTGTNFSSWYNQTEGTIFVNAKTNVIYGGQNIFPHKYHIRAAAAPFVDNITQFLSVTSAYTRTDSYVEVGDVTQMSSATTVNDGDLPSIISYKLNDFAVAIGNQIVHTDNSGTIPVVDTLRLGVQDSVNGNVLNGHIRKFAYYNTRLPNTELQALTR